MSKFVAFYLGVAVLAVILNTSQACTGSACTREYYLSLSTDQLWRRLTGGNTVGKCQISINPGRGACYLYARAEQVGDDGSRGYPKANSTGRYVGTGCVKAPDFPKRVNTCYFSDRRYGLPSVTWRSFCTRNGKENAVAIIRHALRNKKCGLPDASYRNCNRYLRLNSCELWNKLSGTNKIGECRVSRNAGKGACYLYVNAAEVGDDGSRGYPKNNVNGRKVGTGCVKAPYLPKSVNTCYYSDPRYGLSSSTVNSFCTQYGEDNAVAMIRHALRNKKCGPCLPLV